MILLQETTKWGDDTPNHIYLFKDKKSMKCIGYIKNNTSKVEMFNKPMTFDKRKRTFIEGKG